MLRRPRRIPFLNATNIVSGRPVEDFPSTVMPFILRGVTLRGVDSVYASREKRLAAWQRLASDLDVTKLEAMTSEIPLAEAIDTANKQLAGQTRGRVVVSLQS